MSSERVGGAREVIPAWWTLLAHKVNGHPVSSLKARTLWPGGKSTIFGWCTDCGASVFLPEDFHEA